MLTIEEYISQMKKKDKLDEFDFKNHAQNMTSVIGYVMDYFNNYLDPETYDYERIKTEQTIKKISQEIDESLPLSKEFVVKYYNEKKIRIDRIFKNFFKDLEYVDLFYCDADYEKAVNKFCKSSKMKNTGIEEFKDNLIVLAKEIKIQITDKPGIADFKFLDSWLVTWIKETYSEYGVNLYTFADTVVWEYYEKYVEYKNLGSYYGYVHINNYNYRYNEDPFCIGDIYKNNCHRPFLTGKKGELEMILMHYWLGLIHDDEYWPEYVNLCIDTGRVNFVKNLNILLPVINKGIEYPCDIKSTLVFMETTDGCLKENPGSAYVLRLSYKDIKDTLWKDQQLFETVMSNLKETFERYGAPYALELLSPLRSDSFNEEEFFERYRQLEKKMKKYSGMIISLVNGTATHRTKPNYLMQSVDDIVKIIDINKKMKLKLNLTIDINKLLGRKSFKYDIEGIFGRLIPIRSSIAGVHFSKTSISTNISEFMGDHEHYYLNTFKYSTNSDLLGCLSILLNDNQLRYFVPEKIENQSEFEDLVDNLLKGGFSFDCKEVE